MADGSNDLLLTGTTAYHRTWPIPTARCPICNENRAVLARPAANLGVPISWDSEIPSMWPW